MALFGYGPRLLRALEGDEILDFSQLDSGRSAWKSEPFPVRELIAGATAAFAQPARVKGLTLTTELSPELPALLIGDTGRLRQVVRILVGNAVKFTDQGGVTVRAHGQSEGNDTYLLKVTVLDSGPGVSSETASRLFVPFTQADASHSRRYGGLGLGLAVAQQIVARMNGEIGVESGAGGGATFWFTARFQLNSEAGMANR